MLKGLLCPQSGKFAINVFSLTKKGMILLAYVADGLPLPLRIATKIRVHFLESLYPYEHETSMKKNFHYPVSELPPKQYGQSSLNGLNWLYDLAGNSETGW